MLVTLAFRHLRVKKRRSLFLLLGYAIGVGVMIVLLSIGEAMLLQSRDAALVGGGQVTVLPQGIDVEAMRTGGMGSLFFGVDRARFVGRQLLGGPRQRGRVAAVAPAIEHKLVYVLANGRAVPVRAGGEVPSRAAAVGAGIRLVAGDWADTPADSAWIAPSPDRLYHELDRFHRPAVPDSTWGEWHYFNVVTGPSEWWYVTYLVGGAVGQPGRWGGQLLVTHRRPDGDYEQFSAQLPDRAVALDTAGADLTLGASTVRQRDGRYELRGEVPGRLSFALEVRPVAERYFPPVELRSDRFVSGYVVPALRAVADGRFCVAGRCTAFAGANAYHDHNWGVWRDVTWEWGMGRGAVHDLLYGGVVTPDSTQLTATPFFLAVVDSLGMRQVLRFRAIAYRGSRPARTLAGPAAVRSPEGFTLVATREADSVRVEVAVVDALASAMRAGDFSRYFVQMRGRFVLSGRIAGAVVADTGSGFFETYVGR